MNVSLYTDYILLQNGFSLRDIDNMFFDEHEVVGAYFNMFRDRDRVQEDLRSLNTSNPTEEFLNEFKKDSRDYNMLLRRAIEKV